jgi:hypothetical protein
MQAFLKQGKIVLQFGKNEASLLRRIFRNLKANYEIHPSRLDKTTQETWYSTRGCVSAGMSAEETLEWIEQLHQFRGSHLTIITGMLESLGNRNDEDETSIPLKFEEAPGLLSVLNDHRLLVAAQKGIGQEEMELDFFQAVRELEPEQQMALCDIDLLAQIIEVVLHLLPNSGADWRGLVSDEDFLS